MANRTQPFSSRLFVYLCIGFGALAAWCCVPQYTDPYVEKELRPKPASATKDKKRHTSKPHPQVSPAFTPAFPPY